MHWSELKKHERRQLLIELYKDPSDEGIRRIAGKFHLKFGFVRGICKGSYPTIHRGKIQAK